MFTLDTQREGIGNKQHEMYMSNAYPTRTIFHWLALGLALGHIGSCLALLARVGHYWLALGGRVGSARLFRYQHFGIPNAKSLRWGSKPMRGPKASGFALQWNIGLRICVAFIEQNSIHFLNLWYNYRIHYNVFIFNIGLRGSLSKQLFPVDRPTVF